MRKYCIVANLKPACVAAYKEKHKAFHLGPHKELLQVIRDSGVREECVFMHDSMIIIYFEADNLDHSYQIQGASPLVQQWNEMMKPMFADTYEFNEESNSLPVLEKVFDLSEQLNGKLKV